MLSIIRGKIARIFSRSMSTSRILAFFCSTFSLSNLWLFTDDLQKVCFDPYKSEKNHFCLNDIDFSVMPCLTKYQRLSAFGMLQAGLAQNIVARHFDVHRNTIQSLLRRFRQFENTRDRQRPGRPHVTSRQQDNHIRMVHLRDRFQTSMSHCKKHPRITTNQL